MRERFEGDPDRGRLVDALLEQKLVGGNLELAREIAATGELIEVQPQDSIIRQGSRENGIYLILAGQFQIVVNGRRVAMRGASNHVGEMAAAVPFLPRSASVIASEESLVYKLTEPQLSDLGRRYPEIWRRIAKELAKRLEQRNVFVPPVRERPKVFIISSTEALDVARTMQNAFQHDAFTAVVWTDGVFLASHYPIESLERQLDRADLAIAVTQPDDRVEARGRSLAVPRDNVVFELGFFMGRLGRIRTILVEPRCEGEKATLPSDLIGITTLKYGYNGGKDLSACLGPACNQIRDIVRELGPIS